MFHKTKLTQAQRILKAVKNSKGVTNWELSKISLDYTARISELRKDGHNIRCFRDWKNDRATQTFRYYEVV
jgi:dimeric dUTPase (all-alpha-NTP-PPase superfamily)